MNTFSIGEAIRFGWDTFKKRPALLIGVTLFIAIISGVLSSMMPDKGAELGSLTLLSLAGIFVSIVGQILLKMGTVNFQLKAHDNVSTVAFSEMWAPDPLWKYIGAAILTAILVVIGFILLIIPGIYLALRFMFVPYIVMDRKLSPFDALKESSRITHGRKWTLLLFVITLIGLNILGAIALLIGLLVTIPVTMLALAHAYRTLEHTASEVAVV